MTKAVKEKSFTAFYVNERRTDGWGFEPSAFSRTGPSGLVDVWMCVRTNRLGFQLLAFRKTSPPAALPSSFLSPLALYPQCALSPYACRSLEKWRKRKIKECIEKARKL